jgi:hypothetical protein
MSVYAHNFDYFLFYPKKLSWTGKNPLMVRRPAGSPLGEQAHPEGISSGELR